jgi:hypothetical protein
MNAKENLNKQKSQQVPNKIVTKLVAKISGKISQAIEKLITQVPVSNEIKLQDPRLQIDSLISKASWRAAQTAGLLAIPPGPFGMLTILPDLFAIWKIQSQLVADIAAVTGKSKFLGREAMLYCLFRHSAAHIVNELATRVAERVLVRKTSLKILQNLLEKLGVRVSQKILGRSLSRWIPVGGAIAIAWYAKHDTRCVGENARLFFQNEFADESTLSEA